uniref:Calmodulin binding protein n=1 Tax=Solanum tuberosum TaxID=4113 RepID=M1B6E9_SOLTU
MFLGLQMIMFTLCCSMMNMLLHTSKLAILIIEVYFTGLLHQSKGLHKAALTDFTNALAVDPSHVPSLISTAVVLRQLGNHSPATLISYLRGALRLDRTNVAAWHNLGLIYKEEGSAMEAAECFETAWFLEESEPIEPFR